ncbi:MAG: MlaE family ABC transporter permease [Candidatus Melainabacteria bacterium]
MLPYSTRRWIVLFRERRRRRLLRALTQPLTAVLVWLEYMGLIVANLWAGLWLIIRGRIDWGQTIQQAASIGYDSIPIAILICMIAGAILSLQTAEQFINNGADGYVGGMVAVAMVREMSPIFTALTVGARSGTAITAQIANMKVTEQVSAMQILHVSPIRYLVVPRLIAAVLVLPLLTFLGEVMGVLAGMVVAQSVANIRYVKYMDSIWLYLGRKDITVSLVKAVIFGLILVAISCTRGLMTEGGAKDVGSSTTRAVIGIAIAIIIADFFLSWIFFGTDFTG